MVNLQELKKMSESKHRRVTNYLKKQLPGCTVKYNGVEGHDIYIENMDRTVWIEIKTCDNIVCNGLDHKKMQESNRPEIFNIHRIGRLKFDRRNMYPYTVSQHDDLIQKDGWYLFFVGKRLGKKKILFGMKAKDVELSEKPGLKQLEWGRLSMLSHPDWFETLKKEIHGSEKE